MKRMELTFQEEIMGLLNVRRVYGLDDGEFQSLLFSNGLVGKMTAFAVCIILSNAIMELIER